MFRNKVRSIVRVPRFYLGKIRNDIGISQLQLAKKLDMNPSKYNELENGKRGQYMDIRLIVKLAKTLEVDLLKFIELEIAYRDEVDKANGVFPGEEI